MKYFKKIFGFILVIALCASLFTVAYAKKESHGDDDDKDGKQQDLSADIQTLVNLGLLIGSDEHGVTYEYSKSKPTRIQAFIVYLRLMNELQNFDQYFYHDDDDNFDDHHGNSRFVQKGMAFAKAHPEFNWIGSNGKFNPMAHLTAREYAKVLLTVLGYQVDVDFTWNTVESIAEGLGLNVPEGAFTFEEFATMTVRALNMYIKGSTTQKLIDRLGISPMTDTTKPTVTDVVLSTSYIAGPPIVTGKVTVYFSEVISTDTLKDLANYAVDLDGSAAASTNTQLSQIKGTSAVLAADRKSVTLTIPGSTLNGGTAAGAGVTNISVSGLKDMANNIMDPITAFIRKAANLTVTATPAAIAVNKLQVTFSNPMKTIDSTEFKLYKPDGVTLVSAGTGYVLDSTGKIVTISLNGNLTATAKTDESDTAAAMLAIGTINTKDIFGNAVSGDVAVAAVSTSTPAKVTIADKIAPSVTSIETGTLPYTFVLTFTEPIKIFDQSKLKITNLSGVVQTATYAYNSANFTKLTVTITPTDAVENKYNVELQSQGINDLSDNFNIAYTKLALTVLTNHLP